MAKANTNFETLPIEIQLDIRNMLPPNPASRGNLSPQEYFRIRANIIHNAVERRDRDRQETKKKFARLPAEIQKMILVESEAGRRFVERNRSREEVTRRRRRRSPSLGRPVSESRSPSMRRQRNN
jgi:hypothetical protein